MEELGLRDPRAIRALVQALRPLLFFYFRAEVRGLGRLPRGPAILVANHGGGMGPGDLIFFLSFCTHFGPEQPIYALAHRIFVRIGWLRRLLARFGVLEANPANALAVLRAGGKVLVYPGADYDSLRPFSQRHRVFFGGRSGFARLAARARVPIVPVVTAGSHETFVVLVQGRGLAERLRLHAVLGIHTFPVILCLPWLVIVGPLCLLPYFPLPARITVDVGDPIELPAVIDEAQGQEHAESVRRVMETILAALYAERRIPILG